MYKVVPLSKVIPLGDLSSPHFVRKMKSTLLKQGQIEPLQVHVLDEDHYIVWHDDPWGNEIVYAARELGWNSILIVETSSYLQ